MFAVVVEFNVKPGEEDAFREAILIQAKNSLEKEPACRQFDVHIDREDANRFVLYESYDDEAAFAAHRETAHYAAYNALVTPLVASKSVMQLDRL